MRFCALLVSLLLCSCVQQAPLKLGDGQIYLRSSYPMIKLDGAATPNFYRITTAAGRHQLTVRYKTVLRTYLCEFDWQAEAGQVYEVVRDNQADPLTLYRWTRVNALWASRTQARAPNACRLENREPGSAAKSPGSSVQTH